MIGVVVVSHGGLAEGLKEALEIICGPQQQMAAVALDSHDDVPTAARALEKAYDQVRHADGVVIFTDLLGGTPSNIALTFLNRPKVEVISGVNLPMLLRVISSRAEGSLGDVVAAALQSGREGITAATDILRPRRKAGDGGQPEEGTPT
jgi:PTS system mannose-specific IIA component